MLSKYTNLYFPICSLIISLVILILFFSKKKIKNYDTNLYSKLVIIGMCESSIYTFICLIAHFVNVENNYTIYALLNKFLYSIYIVWFTVLFTYIVNLYLNNRKNSILKYLSNSILLCFDIIVITLIFLLRVDIYYNPSTGMSNSYGPASNVLFIAVGIYIFSMIIMAIIDLRNNKHKKYIPFYLLLLLMVIALIIRQVDPLFSIYTNVLSLTLLIMYFTIENPDLKMLEEINRNRELIEKSNEEKSNTLFKITQDVKEPVLKIEKLSNKIINSDSILQIHNDAKDIKNISKNTFNVINNVFDITQFDTSNIKIINTTYNIYNLFNQTVHIVNEKNNNNINFKYSISNTLPEKLYGDHLKLKQVIYSILFDGLKSPKNSRLDLDIQSIVKYDICRLIITINNSSKYIEPDKINDILESDVDITKIDLNKYDNFNIDLKVIKKIIYMLGGNFIIKSDDKYGTTVTIILDQKINDKQVDDIYHTSITNKNRMMIINDDYKELELLANNFKKSNFEVIPSMYGKDCIDCLKNDILYNLILIDDEMKPNNAVELIAQIKKYKNDDCKVIIMLDKEKENIKNHYLKDYPFDDYFLKNSYIEETNRIIKKYYKN
ncbi:MAG: hypothetical protein IJO32_07375 [Bacilli bacterium]|nr:hypothetical protein [Bacilli bacterium]